MALQPFDSNSVTIPTSDHQLKSVDEPTSLRSNGTPIEGGPGAHEVQNRQPTEKAGKMNFQTFPQEIKDMILKLALPDPRVLYLEMQELEEPRYRNRGACLWRPEPIIDWFTAELMPSANPSFLSMAHVCQEFRSFFLQHYSQLMFWNKTTDLALEDLEDEDLPTAARGSKIRLHGTTRYIGFERDNLEVSQEFLDELEEMDGEVDLSWIENLSFSGTNGQ